MKKLGFILLGLSSILFLNTTSTSSFANATELKNIPIMQVTPVIEKFSLDPASQEEKYITVANQGDQDIKIRVYFAPYSVLRETSDFESQSEYTQIYHWLKVKDEDSNYKDAAEFTILPNSTSEIYYRVSVPESAPGGSQHACVFVETIPEDTESSGITTVSRAAVKIFADVSGNTVKDADIISLNANTLVIDGKVSSTATVKNIGNVDIKPTLTLKVNSLSGETIYDNTVVATIFPENDSELKIEWPDTPMFGFYNFVTAVNILGKQSLIEKHILIVPGWFIIILLALIVAAIVIALRHRKRKIRQKSVSCLKRS